jgi:hypothetical protein
LIDREHIGFVCAGQHSGRSRSEAFPEEARCIPSLMTSACVSRRRAGSDGMSLGLDRRRQCPAFARSPEARDGFPDPLNRWSKRAIDSIAGPLDATALYPFGGLPRPDFQRWALKAEAVYRSPPGLLIHPKWGLWHSYRGALAVRQRFNLAPHESAANPCEVCRDRPCLSARPVSAFAPERPYEDAACRRISKPAKRTARPEPASLDLHLVPRGFK